jgi:hypothetical protein
MYRWVPGKRTRVQTEPAPSDYVRPLEFDRIREGQNPPSAQVGLCKALCKGLSQWLVRRRPAEMRHHIRHIGQLALCFRRGSNIRNQMLPFVGGAFLCC